jgi:uncharacterized protein (DUF169 family)
MIMSGPKHKETAEFISNNLRLKTFPVAVKFLKDTDEFPEKTRQPSKLLGKRVAICQAVTMARLYGWTVGLTKEDLVCVPAAIAFGFSESADSASSLARVFCAGNYSQNEAAGLKDASSMTRLEKGEYKAIVLSPLQRAVFEPDTIVLYGNPGQIMRAIQACSYVRGERVRGNFGGKVECSEYLLAPFKEQAPRVAIPGMGDRIFSLTQDDELVFALPGKTLSDLVQGLMEAGSKVGAKYPAPVFLNFQPEFPKSFLELGKELGIL